MAHPISQPLKFKANAYDLDGNTITDAVLNAEVFGPDGTSIQSGTAVVVGSHYEYVLDVGTPGVHECLFTTSDPDVLPASQSDFIEVVAWIDRIDDEISSRLAADDYTVPPNTTQIQSSAAAALTAAGYTSERSTKLDNLDAPVSGAATVADLPDQPLTSLETISAVQAGLTAQGYTTARAGFLDTLNGLVAAIWDYTNRSFTSFVSNVTLNLGQTISNTPQVNPYLLHLVYGDTYDYDDGRSLFWEFNTAQCPLLVADDVPRLRLVDSTGATVMNITGTPIVDTRQMFFEPSSADTDIGDNTEELSLSFQITVTRQNGHVITLIPYRRGKAVLYPRAT